MKRLLALLALVLFLLAPITARAQEDVDKVLAGLDTRAVEEMGADAGFDFRAALSRLSRGENLLDPDALMQALAELLRAQLSWIAATLTALVAPALIWALINQLTDAGGAARAAGYVCYLVVAATLVALLGDCMAVARLAVDKIGSLSESLFPILSALLVSTGATATAATFTPLSALMGALLASMIDRVAFALCGCVAALVIAGNLSEKRPLDTLTGLIKSLCNWMMCAGLSAFLGILTVQGVLGSGYDGASMRTAKYAVDSLLPIVGGEVADTLDVMVSSALLVKNAVGAAGLILLVTVCMRPILRLAASMILCKLAAALIEPISVGGVQKLIAQFSGALGMLLAAVATAMVLLMVLIGAAVGAGNAVLMLR